MGNKLFVFALCAAAAFFAARPCGAQNLTTTVRPNPNGNLLLRCDDISSGFCTDTELHKGYDGNYVGHDEPSLLFYSSVAGSGNSAVWLLTLPKDPVARPRNNNQGGTWNFQLHPAFWVGMAMCDSQSFPEFTAVCNPDTDANIFDSPSPVSPHFIGNHPGAAFMEMQFYPPGWIGSPQLIDPQNYFAALNIDSFGLDGATLANNNSACLNSVGQETVNFAVLTLNGVPILPPNPGGVNFGNNNFDLNNVLSMALGDQLLVTLQDTPAGFQVVVQDLTSGQTGSMVASGANGFGQVLFQPNATVCTIAPYDFHPMYATASEHTRVPWAAHSYNIAFSDEIGHFETCTKANVNFPFNCLKAGPEEGPGGVDFDDFFCFGPFDSFFPGPPFQLVGGCINEDLDFDGQSYALDWPGTAADPKTDKEIHAQPIVFQSPLFFNSAGQLENYKRAAFEANVIDFEAGCNVLNGAGCTLPPPPAAFYPFYTNGEQNGSCVWQLGGANIPGTTNAFGGSAATEFGSPVPLVYDFGSPFGVFEDLRNVVNPNPCAASPAAVADIARRVP